MKRASFFFTLFLIAIFSLTVFENAFAVNVGNRYGIDTSRGPYPFPTSAQNPFKCAHIDFVDARIIELILSCSSNTKGENDLGKGLLHFVITEATSL